MIIRKISKTIITACYIEIGYIFRNKILFLICNLDFYIWQNFLGHLLQLVGVESSVGSPSSWNRQIASSHHWGLSIFTNTLCVQVKNWYKKFWNLCIAKCLQIYRSALYKIQELDTPKTTKWRMDLTDHFLVLIVLMR